MSVNEEHAKEVFFKQFTTCLRHVRNPGTGRNFFEEVGVDLREGKDVQTRKVLLPHFVEVYALDAARYAGEGKNVLFAVFDEIAEVRYDRAKIRYDNIRNTAHSRFHDHYKIAMISYPRDEFDFMMAHYNEVEEWDAEMQKTVYRSRKAPWEVRCAKGANPFLVNNRLYKTKADYAPLYRKNPVDAARRYECIFPEESSRRYLKKFELILDRCVRWDRPTPIISDETVVYVTEDDLLNDLSLESWFKPGYSYEAFLIEQELHKHPDDEELKKRLMMELARHEQAEYFIHIDLAKGGLNSAGVNRDCAGLVIMHPYSITPNILGYYVDLAIQIRPEDKEINFEDIRKFIFRLSAKGYDIGFVSLDGFESIDFKQILERHGVNCDIVSCDRTRKPYDTLKDLLYQGNINLYNYLPLIRELKELAVNEKGKVDHPPESPQRLKEEGMKQGSKDISDALAGAVFAAVSQDSDVGPLVVDMDDIKEPDIDNFSDFLPT